MTQRAQKIRNVLLVGRVGQGKSTLANVLTGTKKFKESSSGTAETKEIEHEEIEVYDLMNNLVGRTYNGHLTVDITGSPRFLRSRTTSAARLGQIIRESSKQIVAGQSKPVR